MINKKNGHLKLSATWPWVWYLQTVKKQKTNHNSKTIAVIHISINLKKYFFR